MPNEIAQFTSKVATFDLPTLTIDLLLKNVRFCRNKHMRWITGHHFSKKTVTIELPFLVKKKQDVDH